MWEPSNTSALQGLLAVSEPFRFRLGGSPPFRAPFWIEALTQLPYKIPQSYRYDAGGWSKSNRLQVARLAGHDSLARFLCFRAPEAVDSGAAARPEAMVPQPPEGRNGEEAALKPTVRAFCEARLDARET